jgi:hypothetical protein
MIKSLPRRIFDGSIVFADMFEMPQNESNPIDGVDEAHPLQLDVSMDDLVCFTSVSETRYAAICP